MDFTTDELDTVVEAVRANHEVLTGVLTDELRMLDVVTIRNPRDDSVVQRLLVTGIRETDNGRMVRFTPVYAFGAEDTLPFIVPARDFETVSYVFTRYEVARFTGRIELVTHEVSVTASVTLRVLSIEVH